MARMVASMSMPLDSFVADRSDGTDRVFASYVNPSESSVALLQEIGQQLRAVLVSRRTFDTAGGMGGQHPLNVSVFIVTPNPPMGWDDAPFAFVTDGLESAIYQARKTAGDWVVGVSGADIVQQGITAGLIDELAIDLVPVLLGDGISVFGNLGTPVELDGPRLVGGNGVTHRSYRIKQGQRTRYRRA